ncbi:MAG: phosphonoacetaldehyde hydrolase [Syntrophobacteraceae bacterium]
MIEIFSRNNPYRGPVRAVILDWGGTSVDHGAMGTVQLFIQGFKELWIEVTEEEVRSGLGLAPWDHISALLGHDEVQAKWRDIYGVAPSEYDLERIFRAVEMIAPTTSAMHCEPVPGLLETVAELRGNGIRIGSSSSRTFNAMEALSGAARERGYAPDAVVCSSDVPGGRPYPWMCFRNAVDMETYPLASIVKIGDTVADIQEGLNAGMWTVGVTKTGGYLGLSSEQAAALDEIELRNRLSVIERQLLDAGAHFVIESVWDCPVIIEQINAMLALGRLP